MSLPKQAHFAKCCNKTNSGTLSELSIKTESKQLKNRSLKSAISRFSIAYFFMVLFTGGIFQNVHAQCGPNSNGNRNPGGSIGAGTGNLVVIGTNTREGQWARINGISNGNSYLFTISSATSIITVRENSRTGTVVGYGTGSVIIAATSNNDLYVHWNTASCGASATNRTTTVQALPAITSLGSTSGCMGETITINGANLTGATASNVQIGGTAVASIVSNTATQIVATIGTGTTGLVTVDNGAGIATSTSSFTVNALPNDVLSICGFNQHLLRLIYQYCSYWLSVWCKLPVKK